jgi:hypothetical protein
VKCLRIGKLHIHAHRWLQLTLLTCDVGKGREVLLGLGPLTFYWTGTRNYDIGCRNAPVREG